MALFSQLLPPPAKLLSWSLLISFSFHRCIRPGGHRSLWQLPLPDTAFYSENALIVKIEAEDGLLGGLFSSPLEGCQWK